MTKRKAQKALPPPDPQAKRPVGRPSEYRPEYADLLLAYFQMPAWETAVKTPDGGAKVVEGFFPTLAGFCAQIGTTQPTLRAWASAKNEDGSPKHPEFLSAYELSKEYQEDYFTKGYMAGKYSNPDIGGLIAKNLLAWKDKQEVEQTVEATVQSTVNQRVEIDFSDIVNSAKESKA